MIDAVKKLKDFQKEVVIKNLELLDDVFMKGISYKERQVTVSPTGSGKTFMMATIIELGLSHYEKSCYIWITHNKQISKQTAENLHRSIAPYTCNVQSIESGSASNARVLLFNVQKGLSKNAIPWLRNWYERQQQEGCSCIFIVDEADEGQSGLNMKSLRNILNPKLEIGFTASFKYGIGDVKYCHVPYADVVKAQMIVENIYYEVSSEVALKEILRKAIDKRNRLEALTNILRGTEGYFVPKMAIQTQASEADNMRNLLLELLNFPLEEAKTQVIVHIQNERGLDNVEDINQVRYIIGDLMIERGWDLPELYVLVAAKDSLSQAKGVQLLGRAMRLPHAKKFEDEELTPLNAGYIYIAGKHSIQKSCEEFMSQGLIPPSGEIFGVETETIYRRTDINLPQIMTTIGEAVESIWSEKLSNIVSLTIEAIFNEINNVSSSNPTIRTGHLDLEGMTHVPVSILKINAEWNYEHTKDILRDALTKHFPQALSELIIGEFHVEVLTRKLSIGDLSGKIREASFKIKKSPIFRRLSLMVELKRDNFEWPNAINVIKNKSLSYSRCLFPKISGLNSEEADFATILNQTCKKMDWYWFRNTPSDIMVVKSGYPDFIVFKNNKYVFIEYKGSHLINSEDSALKNAMGSMSQNNYYMVYKKDKDLNTYNVIGIINNNEEIFNPELHLGLYLK